jgi:hypothetical protein
MVMIGKTNLTSGLQSALSLLGKNSNPLSRPLANGVSNKDYMNHIISRNILSKAAQLVNDLEDARAAQKTLQNFMAKPRGGLFDRLG